MRAIIPCPGQIPELFNTYHFFFLSKYCYSPAPLPLSPISGWGFLCIGLGFGICGSSSLLSVIASSMDWFGFLTGVCSMVSLPLVHLILNGSHSRCLLIACLAGLVNRFPNINGSTTKWCPLCLDKGLFATFLSIMLSYLVRR